jgi:hypothetical protein
VLVSQARAWIMKELAKRKISVKKIKIKHNIVKSLG